KALAVAFGLNNHQSLLSQYVTYHGDVATGKFGTSLYFYPQSVARVVLHAIPWTLGLVGITTILAFVLGTGIGILAAWRRGRRLDSIAPPVFVLTSAIPYFWIGLMPILGFAMSLGFVVGGAILVEFVFNYPGVGYMLLNAVTYEDYPLMQALFLLITVAVLLAILLADIATAIFDPRTRTAG